MKLHYCSNTFVFPPYLYDREFNCLRFYSMLYFRALTCIKYFCVCLLDIFQKVCMYCIFVFAYCHFEQAKYSIMLIAQDQKKEKKRYRNKLGLQTENEPMQSKLFCLVCFISSPPSFMMI